MHLCIVATLCFFKIISPRNYYYCDQDDFPWVYGSKYVSKSNCCQRLFVFYILDVKSFHTYRNINISNQCEPIGKFWIRKIWEKCLFDLKRCWHDVKRGWVTSGWAAWLQGCLAIGLWEKLPNIKQCWSSFTKRFHSLCHFNREVAARGAQVCCSDSKTRPFGHQIPLLYIVYFVSLSFLLPPSRSTTFKRANVMI